MANCPLYEIPINLDMLLGETIEAASRTAFFRKVMGNRSTMRSVKEFKRLPVISIDEYRKQRVADVVTDLSQIQWIAGAYRGQQGNMVPIAESTADTSARYDILRDAVFSALPNRATRTAVVLTGTKRRFFGAEIAAILGYHGIPTHLFIDNGTTDQWARISLLTPGVLVILTDRLDEELIPESTELCITFRHMHHLNSVPQLDMYLVDEIGIMAHSIDQKMWVLYNDLYYFEQTTTNDLVVTSIRSRLRPILRIRVTDNIKQINPHTITPSFFSEFG
jgi:hypothetical protein